MSMEEVQANKQNVLLSTGPIGKELMILRAEESFNNDCEESSIFYQVRALMPKMHDRFSKNNSQFINVTNTLECLESISTEENKFAKHHPIIEHIVQRLQKIENENKGIKESKVSENQSDESFSTFLECCSEPLRGFKEIAKICKELPWEWTIIQLTKGYLSKATCSVFENINSTGDIIYLTLLRHCRTDIVSTPITLRLRVSNELFESYGRLSAQFKTCVTFDSKVQSKAEKSKYWKNLDDFNSQLENVLDMFRNAFKPWQFLFIGIPKRQDYKMTFIQIDAFCKKWQLNSKQKVLLSLVALHIENISKENLSDICSQIIDLLSIQKAANSFLLKLKSQYKMKTPISSEEFVVQHYPCILIVDEYLDHFFWEEINVQQEFTRCSCLSSLYSLFKAHESKIKNGYVKLNISNGCSVLNPDTTLQKLEMRMKSFFQYWLPGWTTMCSKKPTHELLFNDFYKRPCYVYAGHGSGLQFINGKHIAKDRIDSVVLLFGCDSVRLYSHGLFSELVGAHLYYEIAKCPAIVGTLLPALDVNMDTIAAAIISNWIRPSSHSIISWQSNDAATWKKTGVIKPAGGKLSPRTVDKSSNTFTASLCAIVAYVHQRKFDSKAYNTVSYVCRGLPAWNSDIYPEPI